MPPRKRKCTPKLSDDRDAKQSKLVLSSEAQNLIDEVEEQVLERVNGLLELANGMQQAIRQEFTLKLMQVPAQVRKMPLKVFKEQYGGDMKSVVLKDMDEIRAASKAATSKLLATNRKLRTGATVPATQRKTRAQAADTPATGLGPYGQPGTVMRAPAMNETIYSATGSPLGVLQGVVGGQTTLQTAMKDGTVLKTQLIQQRQNHPSVTTVLPPKHPGSRTGVPHSMSFTLKGGQQVTVDFDGGLDKVPKELQEEVADLYQSHMDGLTKFAAAFRKKGR